jgi:molecular chaperone DnaK
MHDIAVNHLGSDVKDAIITVPAYFNDNQRKQTREAGEKAGLNVIRLVNEPTAAALAYGFGKGLNKRVVVFDLGGGTFDISILEIAGNVFEVIATHGDTYLGGEDFDLRIVDYLVGEFKRTHNIDLSVDKIALQRLKDAAEKAKIELSNQEKTRIYLPGISHDADLDIILEKSDMETLVEDLVKKCISICERVLGESGLTKSQIDDVILVGGMTKMPLVFNAVRNFFEVEPRKDVNPDEAIAMGAAILANSLDKIEEQTLLLDVTPLSLGIDSFGDIFSKLIPKNTTVPTSVTQIFTTVADNQERVHINVRQGESPKASENALLGSFTLSGIRPAKKMVPRIEVTFRIDLDGILHVSARDKDTGQEQAITIQNYIEPPRLHKPGQKSAHPSPEEALEEAEIIGEADGTPSTALQPKELEPTVKAPLRVRVRYPDIESFRKEFDVHLAKGEGFIETEKPFKVGTDLLIEVLIGSNPNPFRIMGTVMWVNRTKPQRPDDPPQGMHLKYRFNKTELEKFIKSF